MYSRGSEPSLAVAICEEFKSLCWLGEYTNSQLTVIRWEYIMECSVYTAKEVFAMGKHFFAVQVYMEHSILRSQGMGLPLSSVSSFYVNATGMALRS